MKLNLLMTLLLILGSTTISLNAAETQPNIILMMCDDLGYGDTGFNGHPIIKTPYLDAMAHAGVVMTHSYSGGSVCSPTRGTCLTGRHHFRYGVFSANVGHLPKQEVTISEILKGQNYTTGHFGKWHLGTLNTTSSAKGPKRKPELNFSAPWHHGYDKSFVVESAVSTWDPGFGPRAQNNPFYENGKVTMDNLKGGAARVVMDRVIRFIEDAAKENKPFLAVVWFNAPHKPVVAGPSYLEMYEQYGDSAHYYGCITEMDEQVGRLQAKLKELGVHENTLQFFTSDNGPEGPPPKAGALTAGTAGPFSGRKRDIYDGGVRVPTLALWPGHFKAGSQIDVPTSTLDYLPTIAKLAGAPLPDRPIDGIDMLPIIKGEVSTRSKSIPFRFGDLGSLIQGKYKLLTNSVSGEQDVLYDLSSDTQERNNIISAHPELARKMKKELLNYFKSCKKSHSGADYKSETFQPVDAYKDFSPSSSKIIAPRNNVKPLKNVLFIAVDDLNDWVGVFGGHPQAKTPNMDKLAKSNGGIIFDMAYCPASVCGPSRSSLLSSIRPSNSGVYGNSNNMKLSPVLKDAETISQYFSRHGYHSLSAGKMFHKHPNWSGMDQGQWAFDEWAHPIGRHGIKESFPLNKLPMSDGSPAKSKGKEFDWGPTVNPFEKTSDYASAKWAADQISTRDFDGKPFFIALGISKPHLAWHVPQEFFDMHPLADVIVPEIHLDDLDDIIDAKGKQKFRPSEDFLRIQKYDKFKEVTQAYLAACSYADACIGVTLDALSKSQYKDNTIVVIWGDHGWYLGEKLKYRKTQLWEESNRVPLIIHRPNNKSASTHTKAIVNLIDLYPTLAEYCGLPPKEGLDGRTFATVLRKPDTQWEKPALTTMGFKNHSLRGRRYRYTRYADGTEELYDHESDPMEWKNLATDPEMESIMARFRPLLPKHDEPEIPKTVIDKKRMRRALSKINGMSKELKEQSDANKLDPDFVKKIYAEMR